MKQYRRLFEIKKMPKKISVDHLSLVGGQQLKLSIYTVCKTAAHLFRVSKRKATSFKRHVFSPPLLLIAADKIQTWIRSNIVAERNNSRKMLRIFSLTGSQTLTQIRDLNNLDLHCTIYSCIHSLFHSSGVC